ncbi:unnamed protein product [Rhizophagus irregularis]|nr:unnamed protein product [Rhizophagus irregularis]
MASKFHSGLSKDLSFMINNSDDHNVIIQVGKNREFRAHSYILISRSPYFKSAFLKKEFQTTFIVSENGFITNDNVMKFKIPYINPIVFEIILKYIYTGEVDITGQSRLIVFELLVASDELLLEELFEHVRDYLIEKQAIWIQENFVLVLRTVFKLASYKKLQNYCIETICADPQPFFTSKNFLSLNKVRPYKAIIPDRIYEEIEEFYFKGTLPKKTTLPPRTGMIKMIESNIIKPILTFMITNWIERKDSYYNRNKKDNFYNFKLIYRKSRDGNNIIRNKCIGQGAVLILIKTKFSGKIFGGYNPIGWHDNYNSGYFFRNNKQYLSTTESFIFSFTNNEDTRNMKINRVVNSSYAIYDHSGMNGINFGGGDLVLENDYLTLSRSGNYENLRKNRFEFLDDSYKNQYGVEEIEAFSVVKI